MIPKVIHYCWFGGAPKPQSVLRCIDSWKKHCPDYEIREWTEADFDMTQNAYCAEAYESKAWGFVPDYIRLWIIYNYGGIYLDTDVQMLKSFTPLLKNQAFAGFESDTGNFVNFGQGFGAEAGNAVVGEHMHLYDDMHFIMPDGSYNKVPSPQYTTRVLLRYGLDRECKTVQYLQGITIYPQDYFCPKSFATGLITKTENTFSVHHFDASWFDGEQKTIKEKRWKEARADYCKDYILHLPNRIIMKLLGKERYQKVKKLFKRGE